MYSMKTWFSTAHAASWSGTEGVDKGCYCAWRRCQGKQHSQGNQLYINEVCLVILAKMFVKRCILQTIFHSLFAKPLWPKLFLYLRSCCRRILQVLTPLRKIATMIQRFEKVPLFPSVTFQRTWSGLWEMNWCMVVLVLSTQILQYSFTMNKLDIWAFEMRSQL